jgi:hypothetical protein
MCNEYANYVDYDDYLAAFSQTHIPVKWPDAILNFRPHDDTDRQGPTDSRRLEKPRRLFFLWRGCWGP